MKLILIGFMGSGKTTVGQFLAKKLNLELIEMDDLIIKKAGKSIKKIFNEDGEAQFRELETQVSKSLMNKINIDFLKNNGKIIFLKASFFEIEKRLIGDNLRPLFKNKKSAKKIFNIRQKLYEECADLIVDTDEKSVEKISYEIISQN